VYCCYRSELTAADLAPGPETHYNRLPGSWEAKRALLQLLAHQILALLLLLLVVHLLLLLLHLVLLVLVLVQQVLWHLGQWVPL
jgi:hypothetical protein